MITDYSPAVPYERTLKQTLTSGFQLNISGYVPNDCDRFSVNFKCGQYRAGYPEPDNALHINPRFDQNVVVRNSFTRSGWGTEERQGGFPFTRNAPFQLDVTATPFAFRVNVNGALLGEYKYRLPLNTINTLTIEGKVVIYQIRSNLPGSECISNEVPPPYTPFALPDFPIFLNNLTIPTTVQIPGNMQVGMTFHFSGYGNLGADRFSINWIAMNGDVAFHFNPRMHEKTVVRNSNINRTWGPEERGGGFFPFDQGVIFNMMVRCLASHYEVLVNGQLFATYSHRLHPITNIKSVTVDGDVVMHAIHFTR